MSGDSKKRHELQRQIVAKSQNADIALVEKVASFLNSPKKWELIERATTMPDSSNKEFEAQRFVICFDYLNWNECNFEQFDPPKGKKILEILKQVATCELSKFPELKLVRDSVGRSEPYTSLFTNLSKDVEELKETEFCGGRMFFFITEPRFHIVSIETKHRDAH